MQSVFSGARGTNKKAKQALNVNQSKGQRAFYEMVLAFIRL